jgi:type II secretory pathway component PulM
MMARKWNLDSLSSLRNRYDALNVREKAAVILALGAVLCFALLQFVLFPMTDTVKRLESTVKTRQNELSELRRVTAQYKQFSARHQGSKGDQSADGGSLFSILERLAAKDGLMDEIDYMKPGAVQLDTHREEKWVEVKLSEITVKQFTNYLYNLQSFGKGIYIKRLSARKDGDYLNLILQPAVIEYK